MRLSDNERELLISERFTMSLMNTDLASYMIEERQNPCQDEGKNNE